MKTLLILCLVSSPVLARNDAAEAFATGFANALNVQMGGRPYTPPTQVQQVEVYTPPARTVEPHVDAVTSDNRRAGYFFFNTSECLRFLHRSGFQSGYTACTDVY